MLGEAQDQAPHLLHHRGGAIGAHIAHGYSAFARGDADRRCWCRWRPAPPISSAARRTTVRAYSSSLFKQHDIRVAECDPRSSTRSMSYKVRSPAASRSALKIQIAVGDGVVVQKYGFHGLRVHDALEYATHMKITAVIILIAANVAGVPAAARDRRASSKISLALWPLQPIEGHVYFRLWQIVTYAFLHDPQLPLTCCSTCWPVDVRRGNRALCGAARDC